MPVSRRARAGTATASGARASGRRSRGAGAGGTRGGSTSSASTRSRGAADRRARLPRVHADRDPARGLRRASSSRARWASAGTDRVRDHGRLVPAAHGPHTRRDDGRAASGSRARCSRAGRASDAGSTAPPWGLYLVGVGLRLTRVRFPVVLFDLDGTLVDSGAMILGSIHHATRDRAQPRHSQTRRCSRQVGGSNLAEQMQLLAPGPRR